MTEALEQQHGPQLVQRKAHKGGRKRRRAREIPIGVRRMIPGALAACGDIERVSEDYGVAKVEALAECVVHLLRKGPGTAPYSTGLPYLIERRA